MHLKSSLAALGIASIVATGLGAVPSVAASGNLVFICGTVLGDKEFITTADTDLPATLATGASAPVNVTAKVTIPDDVRNAVYTLFGARKVAGTAKIKATQNGAALPDIAANVASTDLPDSGPVTVTATGAGTDLHADRRGHLRPQGGQLHRSLVFTKADGSAAYTRRRDLHAEADHAGPGPHGRHVTVTDRRHASHPGHPGRAGDHHEGERQVRPEAGQDRRQHQGRLGRQRRDRQGEGQGHPRQEEGRQRAGRRQGAARPRSSSPRSPSRAPTRSPSPTPVTRRTPRRRARPRSRSADPAPARDLRSGQGVPHVSISIVRAPAGGPRRPPPARWRWRPWPSRSARRPPPRRPPRGRAQRQPVGLRPAGHRVRRGDHPRRTRRG